MDWLWRFIPISVAGFALAFIGWMGQMLRMAWLRNDSWGFTVTVASVVIPVFLIFIWLAVYVLWGIAREAIRGKDSTPPAAPAVKAGGAP
jgi:uncharacterized membrane protein YcjF (UPF0283 family)